MDFHFYHLEYNPFVAQSSDALFWNAMYQRVWDQLLDRIDERQGIIGLLGEPGLGKTTLLQTYRSSVDPKYIHVIDGVDATLPPPELLASLAQACSFARSASEPESLFNAFYQHCQSAYTYGRQLVWLIDDAHLLSMHALENIHSLFERLHREGEPMLQIVLCGRPTLQKRCHYPALYLFEQALPTALSLSPLGADDRAAYIHHYLGAASTKASKIFTKRALNLIIEHTQGIPKVINITCTDVLVAGLMAAEKPISVATVQTVLHDNRLHLSPMVRWGAVSAAGLLLAAGIWGGLPESTPPVVARTTSPPVVQAPPPPVAQTPPPAIKVPPPAVKAPPKIAQMPAPLARAVVMETPLKAAARPIQPAPPEPAPIPPVATPLEAKNKIRELRERQALKITLAKAPERDRHADHINLAKLVETDGVSDKLTPKPPKQPGQKQLTPTASQSTDADSATFTSREPTAPSEPEVSQAKTAMTPSARAQTVPSQTVPPTSKSTRPHASEVVARLSPETRRNSHPKTRQPRSAGQRAALVASTSARLLCAMPRTGGRRGSDIVLLGHRRRPVHRLIEDGSQNMSPVLSPDGSRLAYTSYRGGSPNIYLRDLASGREIRLTTGSRLALPGTWSPDGRYLSLSQNVNGNNDIYIYDTAQKRLRRLTQHKGIDVSPSFAPDSQRLVFSSDRTGSPQLYITDITGLSPVRLTHSGSYNTSPSWSPRDDVIAFIGRSQKRALDLYIIKPDGSKQKRLTEGQRFHTPPAWLPDGGTLMGMSLRGAVWERHLMQLDPNQTTPILPKPESLCLAPQWVAYRVP